MRWLPVVALALTACAGEGSSGSTGSTAPTPPAVSTAPPAIGTRAGSTADDAAPTIATPGDSTPEDSTPEDSTPEDSTPSTPDSGGVVPEGFERVAARVTEPGGEVCDLCLWLAETADQRSRGLMFVTDLGPAQGMAFRYPEPHTGSFWMKNTVLPLSIAFFGEGGGFLDAFDMAPCTADPCQSYATPSDFTVAVEVPEGGLDGLGMVPGSRLELLDLPCG